MLRDHIIHRQFLQVLHLLPLSHLLMALLITCLIFIPEHQCLFFSDYPLHAEIIPDFLITFFLLLINWIVFKKYVFPSNYLRKSPSVKVLKRRILGVFILQMLGNVLVVKWYLNLIWGQSVMSFITDEFGPSTLLIGSWYAIALLKISLKPNVVDYLKKTNNECRLKSSKSGKMFFISFNEIDSIRREDNYTVIYTQNGKKHLMDESLDALIIKLPEQEFFRVNRQIILPKKAIKGFEKIENRKLCVHYVSSSNTSNQTIVSRYKAKSFQKWIEEPS